MDIIQEAKAISTEFKEIEAEYNSPDSLIDMGNWYYISKKQDEIISRLVDRLEGLEKDCHDMNEVAEYWMRKYQEPDKYIIEPQCLALPPVGDK